METSAEVGDLFIEPEKEWTEKNSNWPIYDPQLVEERRRQFGGANADSFPLVPAAQEDNRMKDEADDVSEKMSSTEDIDELLEMMNMLVLDEGEPGDADPSKATTTTLFKATTSPNDGAPPTTSVFANTSAPSAVCRDYD